MISKMTQTGLGGRDRVLKFDRLNLIVGQNGTGKTTTLLQVMYGATGKTPTGDRPGSILAYSKGGQCSVTTELDDGFKWERACGINRFTKATSTNLAIAGQRKLGKSKSEAMLAERVGDFAPMFDYEKFLAMRPEQRRELVLDLFAGPESLAADEIAKKVDVAKEELSDAEADHRGLVASVRDTTTRKNECPAPIHESRDDMKRKQEEAEGELSEIDQQIGKRKGVKVARDRLQKVQERAAQLAKDTAKVREKHLASTRMVEVKSELGDKTALAESPEPAAVDLSVIEKARDKRDAKGREHDEVDKARRKVSDELGAARIAEATESTKLRVCADWKKVADILESMEPSDGKNKILAIAEAKLKDFGYDELAAKVEGFKSVIATTSTEIERLAGDYGKITSVYDEIDARIVECENENREANKTRDAKLTEINAAKVRCVELTAEINQYDHATVGCDEMIKRAKQDALDAEGELAKLDTGDGESLESLESRRAGIAQSVLDVKQSIELRQTQDELTANLQELTAKASKSEDLVEKKKKAVSDAKKERDDALSEMMKPLVEGISDFVGETAYSTLVKETGAPTFEMGIVRDGGRISMDVLSGAEKLMFCVGLIVSMTNLSGQKEKFLLLEGRDLDVTNLSLIADRITTHAPDFQVFLTRISAPLGLDGWRVHEL